MTGAHLVVQPQRVVRGLRDLVAPAGAVHGGLHRHNQAEHALNALVPLDAERYPHVAAHDLDVADIGEEFRTPKGVDFASHSHFFVLPPRWELNEPPQASAQLREQHMLIQRQLAIEFRMQVGRTGQIRSGCSALGRLCNSRTQPNHTAYQQSENEGEHHSSVNAEVMVSHGSPNLLWLRFTERSSQSEDAAA